MPGNPNPESLPVATAIDGVFVQELRWYSDQRGSLSVLLRSDQQELNGSEIGQIYVTTVRPGVVKAWHRHKEQTDRMVGLRGQTLLVLMDGREDSPSYGAVVEQVLGDRHHTLVMIPPGVWHGLKCLGEEESMVLNAPSRPYSLEDPDEERAAPHEPPAAGLTRYDWRRIDA